MAHVHGNTNLGLNYTLNQEQVLKKTPRRTSGGSLRQPLLSMLCCMAGHVILSLQLGAYAPRAMHMLCVRYDCGWGYLVLGAYGETLPTVDRSFSSVYTQGV